MKARYRISAAFTILGCFSFYIGLAPVSAEEPLPEVYTKVNIEYKAEVLDDPFIDYKAEQSQQGEQKPEELKPLPPLTVQGMIWGGSFSQAIINNKVLKVGDTIEGVQIKEINKEGIDVIYEKQLYKIASPASTNYGKFTKVKKEEAKK